VKEKQVLFSVVPLMNLQQVGKKVFDVVASKNNFQNKLQQIVACDQHFYKNYTKEVMFDLLNCCTNLLLL